MRSQNRPLLRLVPVCLLVLLLAGCSRPAPVAPAEPPPPPSTEAPPAGRQALEYRYEELKAAPAEVREWVSKLSQVPVGASLNHGDRTYLLVSAPDICPEASRLSFWSVEWLPTEKLYQATAGFHCGRREDAEPFTLVSIPLTSELIAFDLKYSFLPHLYNPHNLPLPALPAAGSGVIVEPAAGAALGDSVRVAGFASGLFEGTVIIRLVDRESGKVAAETHGQGAGGMGMSWGSFVVDLDTSGAAPGRYWLELGDYSMRDGAWQLKQRIEVEKR